MSEEILINVTPTETRVAVVENGMLQEVSLERNSYLGYLGNIYKGTVSRVLPGMQAAFIDIGLDRTAFLHASDIYKVAREQMPDHVHPAFPGLHHPAQHPNCGPDAQQPVQPVLLSSGLQHPVRIYS